MPAPGHRFHIVEAGNGTILAKEGNREGYEGVHHPHTDLPRSLIDKQHPFAFIQTKAEHKTPSLAPRGIGNHYTQFMRADFQLCAWKGMKPEQLHCPSEDQDDEEILNKA
jgi:hypothetical protein